MLLVSFLLWLCRIFCDLCIIIAFAAICLTAVGVMYCCHGSVFGERSSLHFQVFLLLFFFSLYDTVFLFPPLPFSSSELIVSILLLCIITLGTGRRGETLSEATACAFPVDFHVLMIAMC